jgi:hypothetical protein
MIATQTYTSIVYAYVQAHSLATLSPIAAHLGMILPPEVLSRRFMNILKTRPQEFTIDYRTGELATTTRVYSLEDQIRLASRRMATDAIYALERRGFLVGLKDITTVGRRSYGTTKWRVSGKPRKNMKKGGGLS